MISLNSNNFLYDLYISEFDTKYKGTFSNLFLIKFFKRYLCLNPKALKVS